MRPGEVLSLQRGAAEHDEDTGLWLLHGWHWKDVTGPDGAKLVTGAERADPWVMHEVAAQAVAVLEQLHDNTWLWPDTLFVAERRRHLNRRVGAARTDKAITRDIRLFTEWINTYCQANARADTIPADPSGPLTPSRFRRTLAWNIVRQPKGLVAAAIQYGHIQVRITQGYAGSADSGFLDDLCFEDWLLRLEQFAEAHQHLADGGHVSGPAADEYRRRVGEVHARFAGRVVHTTRQARNLIADPALQVFPGRAMHCVLNQTTAMCQLREGADHTVTPDIDDCRPRCPNIARTDADIGALRADLRRLDDRLDDPLAPAPRRARDQANAQRLRTLISRHEQHQETPCPTPTSASTSRPPSTSSSTGRSPARSPSSGSPKPPASNDGSSPTSTPTSCATSSTAPPTSTATTPRSSSCASASPNSTPTTSSSAPETAN